MTGRKKPQKYDVDETAEHGDEPKPQTAENEPENPPQPPPPPPTPPGGGVIIHGDGEGDE